MRIRLLALAAALLFSTPALAQVKVIASCATGVSPTFDVSNTGGILTIDQTGKLCSTISGTSPAAGADGTANPTASGVFAFNEIFNGTTWDRQRAATGTVGVPSVNTEGTKATYSAVATIIPAASATDIFTITGSASKTIRVTRIQFSGQATATTPAAFALIKRSTADTAGTSAAVTAVPLDSTNAAASATLLNYSANPSLGTTVGTVRQQQMTLIAASTPAVPNVPVVWDFTTRNTQAVVLRGTAQVLALNFIGQTIAGNVLQLDLEWTEE